MRPFHLTAWTAAALLLTVNVQAQSTTRAPRVTAPEAFFSQAPGTDYFLADYTAYEAYLKRLAGESDRMKLVDIGKTAEGRTQWMAIVFFASEPRPARPLPRHCPSVWLEPEGSTEAQARAVAREGKAVVWIDAGMHATETVTSQGQIQVLHRMLTQTDAETLRILDDTIILFAHDNPDGMELVSDWYMRQADPKKREFATLPSLYQKHAGHDNNRDSFMLQLPETENVNRQLFRVWYPQIVYNQHQSGPDGMVVFIPPFRDPFNHNYDPIVMSQLTEIGAAMHSRLIAEGKAGSGMRSVAPYSTWHNGMERSVAYFHNSIGILTEIIGGPTPTRIPLVPSTQLPRGDEPLPIAPQEWRLQQSLDYQWTMNRAVLDYASRNRERLLFNIYRMGANSIERGSKDSWTTTPKRVARLEAAAAAATSAGTRRPGRLNHDPESRSGALQDDIAGAARPDPRGYIIRAGSAGFPDGRRLRECADQERGRSRASDPRAFRLAAKLTRPDRSSSGRRKPTGRISSTCSSRRIIRTTSTIPEGRPRRLTTSPATPLAYQMGIEFDRILEPMDGPFARVRDLLAPPPGRIEGQGRAGWLVGHETNNSFILTNRLLKAGIRPSWLGDAAAVGSRKLQPGAIWIPASSQAAGILRQATGELGITAFALAERPKGPAVTLKPVRIGLADRWGGLMSSGWTRLLLERFEFPFELVFPQRLDAGDLKRDFDVLVFSDGAVPTPEGGPWRSERAGRQPAVEDTPVELRPRLGAFSEARTVPAVEAFAKAGGSVVAIGSSTRLAELLKAPVSFPLTAMKDGRPTALDTKNFFIPGSIVRAKVDNRQPLAYGMPGEVDIFFNRAQTFQPTANAMLNKVSWFDGKNLLRSGWAVGEEKLSGTIAVADLDIGRGKLFLMGPEVTQRAQPYGTFKFLFNALLYGPAQTTAK